MKPSNSKTTPNILSLSAQEALDFFMQSDQYHGFELPEYFDFDEVLNYVKERVGDKRYENCLTGKKPDDLPNVNLDILLNKDGRYAVRPHPRSLPQTTQRHTSRSLLHHRQAWRTQEDNLAARIGGFASLVKVKTAFR